MRQKAIDIGLEILLGFVFGIFFWGAMILMATYAGY